VRHAIAAHAAGRTSGGGEQDSGTRDERGGHGLCATEPFKRDLFFSGQGASAGGAWTDSSRDERRTRGTMISFYASKGNLPHSLIENGLWPTSGG